MKVNTERRLERDNSLSVDIIIPTLNEENDILKVIQDIGSQKLPVKISVLVIDGGSTDKTVEICKKENVRVLIQKSRGKGNAMKEAVSNSSADIIAFIDGDGTYSVNDVGSLLEPILTEKADMVVGSRILGKREKSSISTLNLIGNKLFNNTINFALKSKVTDSLSGFRALRRETFNDLILFSDNFEIEVEMTVDAIAKGYRVMEVPINYRRRKDSETKLRSYEDGVKIGKTLFFLIMNIRPLLFFTIISAILFGISAYPAGLVLYEKIVFGDITHLPSVVLAALLMVTGVVVLVLGIISESLVRSRRRLEYLINKKNNSSI